MLKNKKLLALTPAVLLALIAAIILTIIAVTPFDTASITPANTYPNIANGGFVASDGGMVFFVDGEGVLRCHTADNAYRIAEKADMIAAYENGVVYRTNGDKAYFAAYDGSGKRELISGVKEMMLSGHWIYYKKADGILQKYFIKTGENKSTGLKVGQFTVANTGVLYIGEDSKLYTAYTDGTGVEPFYSEKIDFYVRHGSYVFFKKDGMLYSIASGNPASKASYFKVDLFTVNENNLIIFTDENGLHTYDLMSDKPKVKDIESQGKVTSLNTDGDYIYYHTDDSKLIRCLKDGSEWIYM